MLTKLETKSARVKGLSFHAHRPWILASLHTGTIQLWDYRMCLLLEKFDGHEGPVRGVCFHGQQPLFVSGGDDCKVKVWNYQLKRCVFSLLGHTDYIRSVMFHKDCPWILSGSDDQTIRIWNWQSRKCISLLSGHSHYVMCAAFHPIEDLVISGSLDQSVRVWDISALRKRSVGFEGDGVELFAQSDVIVKHSLEGHTRGVNWVACHPTVPLIASGADDLQVMLWRIDESKAYCVFTYLGHYKNVSCVLFHPSQDLIISNSEDKTIKVWDISRRTSVHTFHREHDRFWMLAAHPSSNLFAAGHDTGMLIFKLERERPAFVVLGNTLYYAKERVLRKLDFNTSKDLPVALLSKGGGTFSVYSVSYNPVVHAILSCVRSHISEGNYYELRLLPDSFDIETLIECKRGPGNNAVWVARNKFAVIDWNFQVSIRNLQNEIVKKFQNICDEIFFAGTCMLLFRNGDKLNLLDVQKAHSLSKLKVPRCRYVIWSSDMSHVALLSKHLVTICNQNLSKLSEVREGAKVKSGAWDDTGVFVYTTCNHIKYVLANGDGGIIRTLDVPIYVTRVRNNMLFCLDRSCKTNVVTIDPTEYRFKVALKNQDFATVLGMVRSCRLVGQGIISYLQVHGYPEVALHFVKDNRTIFDLGIKCGNLEIALKAAKTLNDKLSWERLARAAMMRGNLQTVETCYQRLKNIEKLAFLYLITGNLEKLRNLQKYSNGSTQCQISMLLGDVTNRAEILEKAGMKDLSQVTIATHAIDSEGRSPEVAKYLRPPPPIQPSCSNWPLLNVDRGFFESSLSSLLVPDAEACTSENFELETSKSQLEATPEQTSLKLYSPPKPGWGDGSHRSQLRLPKCKPAEFTDLPGLLVLAGCYEAAFAALNTDLGIVNFEPYKEFFMKIYNSAHAVSAWQKNVPPRFFIFSSSTKPTAELLKQIQTSYQLTTSGQFAEAMALFKRLILQVPLLVTNRKEDTFIAEDVLKISREYLLGLKMETLRQSLPKESYKDHRRNCELAAYFTHCELLSVHKTITLRNALNLCFKYKNFTAVQFFGKRLVEMGPRKEVVQQVQKMMTACEAVADELRMEYDAKNPFVVCGYSFRPIYQGSPAVKCCLCGSSYHPKYSGYVCNVCEVAEIGWNGSGLKIFRRKSR